MSEVSNINELPVGTPLRLTIEGRVDWISSRKRGVLRVGDRVVGDRIYGDRVDIDLWNLDGSALRGVRATLEIIPEPIKEGLWVVSTSGGMIKTTMLRENGKWYTVGLSAASEPDELVRYVGPATRKDFELDNFDDED